MRVCVYDRQIGKEANVEKKENNDSERERGGKESAYEKGIERERERWWWGGGGVHLCAGMHVASLIIYCQTHRKRTKRGDLPACS